MVAIETRYLGPTNHLPSRIVAETCNGQRIIKSFSSCEDAATDGNTESAHRVAAQFLADKMEWSGKLYCGGTKRGYVFVFKV